MHYLFFTLGIFRITDSAVPLTFVFQKLHRVLNIIIFINPIKLSILFTKESISNTLMKLKSGKAPGIDEIPNDFLKFGGDIMIRSLVDMFTAISDIEVIPDDWHSGIIRPLPSIDQEKQYTRVSSKTLQGNKYRVA
jgi:hypothetical protein